MSMIKCPECGEKVSTMAGTCPHCGVLIKGNLYFDEELGEYKLQTLSDKEEDSSEEGTQREPGGNLPPTYPQPTSHSAGLWFAILFVLVLLVGGYFGWDYYEREQARQREAALREQMEAELLMQEQQAELWKKLTTCKDADELQKLIEENQGSPLEGMARDRLDSLRNAQYNRVASVEEKALVKNTLENLCIELSAQNTSGISTLMANSTLKYFGDKADATAEDVINWVKEKEAKDVIGIHYLLPQAPSIEFATNEDGEHIFRVAFTLEETINRSNATATNAANYKVRCTMSKDAKIVSFRF